MYLNLLRLFAYGTWSDYKSKLFRCLCVYIEYFEICWLSLSKALIVFYSAFEKKNQAIGEKLYSSLC